MTNTLKAPVKEVNNMHEQMRNFSREINFRREPNGKKYGKRVGKEVAIID